MGVNDLLKKTCYACGKERKKSNLVYDDRLNAYCAKSHECNLEHPNSSMNLIKHQKLKKLYEHDEAIKLFAEINTSETIKYMSSPITLRLSDVKQATHIEKVCSENNMTISDYIRGLIDKDMQTVVITENKNQEEKKEDDLTF